MKIDWEKLYPELKLQVDRIIDENKVLSVYLIGSGIKKLNSQDEFINMRDVDILVIVESGDPEREVIEYKGIIFDVSYLDSAFVCEFKDYEALCEQLPSHLTEGRRLVGMEHCRQALTD